MKLKKDKRNYIIIGLCMILVVMGVGYAVFSQLLTINGTANITNSWNIEITNIRGVNLSSVQNNGAYDKEEPTVGQDKVSATFHTGLIQPGDTRIYEVEVTNKGSVDADITSVFKNTLSDAIYFSYDGVGPLGGTGTDVLTNTGVYNSDLLSTEEPFSLPANTNNVRYIYITVKYRESVTSQPTNLEATINLELNAEQAPSGREEVNPGLHILKQSGLEIPMVTSGDGLYDNGDGQYIYKGANPNNYLEFEGDIWRIIMFDLTGIKIIREEKLDTDMSFDEAGERMPENNSYCTLLYTGCNAWAATDNLIGKPTQFINGTVTEDATINKYLNEEYYVNTLDLNPNIIMGNFNVGPAPFNSTVDNAKSSEIIYQWKGHISLITLSEYMSANNNQLQCGSQNLNNSNNDICKSTNYLYKSSYNWWILSSPGITGNPNINYYVNSNGEIFGNPARVTNGIRPVLYLKSNITLTGNGTNDENIYKIVS